MRRSLGTAAVLAGLLASAACGSAGGTGPDLADPDRSTTTTTGASSGDTDSTPAPVSVARRCLADAEAVTGTTGMPVAWPWPAGAVVYDVHPGDAGGGVVATAVVRGDIQAVMTSLLTAVADRGFQVTDSEADEHDAEAEWSGRGYTGRWALSDAPCSGEVLIQVVASAQ